MHVTATHELKQLKQKHADLDEALRREENRPMPDEALISQLKKQKLMLKDEMVSLETAPA